MTPEARTALLHGLRLVVQLHAADPARGGLEALRLLRAPGATWCDVLGPTGTTADEYALQLALYGHRASLSAIGRLMMRTTHAASPLTLARIAVLANGPWSQAAQYELADLTRTALAIAAEDTPHAAWTAV